MALKNAYTIKPYDVQPGDEFLFVVKAMIMHDKTYRLYRCLYKHGDIPQGDKIISNAEEIAESLFPVLIDAGCEPG